MNNKFKYFFISISFTLFICSLTQECYTVKLNNKLYNHSGALLFFLGWLNIGLKTFIWLANPLHIISNYYLVTSQKKKLPLLLSLFALILSLLFTKAEVSYAYFGGSQGDIVNTLSGYWLWVSSITITVLYTIILNIKSIKH
ncbi:hypothetical protein F7018_09510 [Tenacibaculum aiptasiae]|uniref:Uncharacterized protein n=1 Tax=Tenacibaculum aiptasiae TaxID=426481 RepID=A0A7J5ALK2_9FLAO|nr:hypothetical protein [Tenacibaculum aiptasiae]KAB1158403.1 hypothetical protein F7018_09510 [Tenacibaculum aiptasiae]